MFIERVGIVGAGTMGADIAAVLLLRGIPVRLYDVEAPQLERAADRIRAVFLQRVQRGRLLAGAVADRMALLLPSTDLAALGDVDLAIEVVPERLALKQAVLSQLDHVVPPLAILATNTSALPVHALAAATGRADRVIGCHFFFPAHTMPLVEVVRTDATGAQVVASAVNLWQECRKVALVVQDRPGFVVNRVLMRALAEVFRFEEETGAEPAAIDAALASSGVVPLGPFRLCDALGLDVALDVAQTLTRELGERFTPSRELASLVAAGRLGAKVAAGGFYPPGTPENRDVGGVDRDRLVRRFQLAAVNEAARLLDERLATPADIDLAMRAGAGLKQGPLGWADREGLEEVARAMEEMTALGLERFRVPESLGRLVRQGWTGAGVGRGFMAVTR